MKRKIIKAEQVLEVHTAIPAAPVPVPAAKTEAKTEARAFFRVFRNDGTIEEFESDNVEVIRNGDGC